MKLKWLREVKSIWILRKCSYISEEKGYSDIIPFVYEDKEEIHKYTQYEISMTVWVGQIKGKYQNGCHLKNTIQNHQISDVHMWGANMHKYIKYEVSMSSPVAGRGVHRQQ